MRLCAQRGTGLYCISNFAKGSKGEEGWYDTKDIVEERDGYYRVTGRTSEVINVGGLKFMASEVERVALEHNHVE